MEIINELELRRQLKRRIPTSQLGSSLVKRILDESIPWEEKRPFWYFLFLSGRESLLAATLIECLRSKTRVPLEIFVQMCAQESIEPRGSVMQALIKGAKKQRSLEELIGVKSWDEHDPRLKQIRHKILAEKSSEQRKYKDGLRDKFEFLQSQRMTEQAGRVLRRMVELFPDENSFKQLKKEFDEQWAREVLNSHLASVSNDKLDRTKTAPSTFDQEMLNCFAEEGEKICMEHREFASDLAVAFWFMDDYAHALDILAYAPPDSSNDWLRAELLFQSRRFIEALELLDQLELRYIDDPETTFAVSYLRAQCLHESGQEAAALEILKSIVNVRPNYRSAQALILEWSEQVAWE